MLEAVWQDARESVIVAAGFGDDIEVFLDERPAAFISFERIIDVTGKAAFEKFVRGAFDIHVHQQDVAFASFRKAGGEAGGRGGDARTFGTTGDGDKLGFMGQVFGLEIEDEPIAQSFVERAQLVARVPRRQIMATLGDGRRFNGGDDWRARIGGDRFKFWHRHAIANERRFAAIERGLPVASQHWDRQEKMKPKFVFDVGRPAQGAVEIEFDSEDQGQSCCEGSDDQHRHGLPQLRRGAENGGWRLNNADVGLAGGGERFIDAGLGEVCGEILVLRLEILFLTFQFGDAAFQVIDMARMLAKGGELIGECVVLGFE